MSGLTADARTLIDHARVEGQNYRFTYDEPISIESLTHSVCDLALKFGEDRDDDNAMVSLNEFTYSVFAGPHNLWCRLSLIPYDSRCGIFVYLFIFIDCH